MHHIDFQASEIQLGIRAHERDRDNLNLSDLVFFLITMIVDHSSKSCI